MTLEQLANKEEEIEIELAPINWSWLAGFFQAEGSMYNYTPSSAHYLTITQKNRLTLEWIKEFLELSDIKSSIYTNPAGISVLTIHANGSETVLTHIFPLLQDYKRRQVKAWNNLERTNLPKETLPIDYDFVVGFWEGDGSINYDRHQQYLILTYYNKYPGVLETIKRFLGKGWLLLNKRDGVTQLATYANVEDLRKLLKMVRTDSRYNQLFDKINNSELLRSRVWESLDA